MKKLKRAVHSESMTDLTDGGKLHHWIQKREVLVMATTGKWAMVRRPGCMPYVCLRTQLEYSRMTNKGEV